MSVREYNQTIKTFERKAKTYSNEVARLKSSILDIIESGDKKRASNVFAMLNLIQEYSIEIGEAREYVKCVQNELNKE